MKRTYSDANSPLTTLPKMSLSDGQLLRSTLTGSHKLKVTKVIDISKPSQKPVDEIEEPEEAEVALQNKLSKSNARMILLHLKDSENQEIKALETEHIDLLNEVKPSYILSIVGPVDIRCGNIMLERKHLSNIEMCSEQDEQHHHNLPPPPSMPPKESRQKIEIVNVDDEDWDEDDENDCICLD